MFPVTTSVRNMNQSLPIAKVPPVSKYGAEPAFVAEEQQRGTRIEREHSYYWAARSAANWINYTQQAQQQLDNVIFALTNEHKHPTSQSLHAAMNNLTDVLNTLQETFKTEGQTLRVEIWSAIELAIRPELLQATGLVRNTEGDFEYRGIKIEDRQAIRIVDTLEKQRASATALSQDLKVALSYSEKHRTSDLLQLSFLTAYPYAQYYGAMQTNSPMPIRGILVNKQYG